MVIDTSALLAIFFAEPAAGKIALLLENEPQCWMSTVNLSETLILLYDRRPKAFQQLKSKLLGSSIQWVAPNVDQAALAAHARMKYPLNLGDCFAYALARSKDSPLLTLDRDFKKAKDIRVIIP